MMSIATTILGWLQSTANIPWWGLSTCVASLLGLYTFWSEVIQHRPKPPNPLADECEQLRRQVMIRDWELGLTRRFLGTRDLRARLELLLKSLVSNSQTGFAAIFCLVENRAQLEQSLGLEPQTSRKLQLSESLVNDTLKLGSLVISYAELARSRGVAGLSTLERSRIVYLYCLRLGTAQNPWGLLISSELPAIHPGEAASLAGWEHLTSILGEELASQDSADRQGNELALTLEMLELRALADQHYRSPSHLLQEYLRRLSEMTDFERATLVLSEDEKQWCEVQQLRGGGPLSRELLVGWEQAEDRLLAGSENGSASAIWTLADLHRLGVHGPFALAVVLPLRHRDWVIGQLCLTRRSTDSINDSQRRLLNWGSEFLVELIARTIDRAAVEQQAKRDGLTNLANRHTFDVELDRSIDRANRHGNSFSLILLDLDHFKSVNDTHGHLGGDAALKTVARIAERSVQSTRNGDQPLVARYGGEELAVILPGVSEAGARRIAEVIREAVMRTPIPFDGGEFHVTLSAGVASRTETVATCRALISAADTALYRAKDNGRNRVEVTPST